jgi:hypothetical protein
MYKYVSIIYSILHVSLFPLLLRSRGSEKSQQSKLEAYVGYVPFAALAWKSDSQHQGAVAICW